MPISCLLHDDVICKLEVIVPDADGLIRWKNYFYFSRIDISMK